MAVISLPPDSLPKARSVAKSIDMGKVQTMTPGRLSTKIFATETKEAPYSVMYSAMRKSVPDPMKTDVNAQMLNRNVIRISLKM